MHLLLLSGAFGHGLVRCSLFQVTVSAINRCIKSDDAFDSESDVFVYYLCIIV